MVGTQGLLISHLLVLRDSGPPLLGQVLSNVANTYWVLLSLCPEKLSHAHPTAPHSPERRSMHPHFTTPTELLSVSQSPGLLRREQTEYLD